MKHSVGYIVVATLALGLNACKTAASFGSSSPSKPSGKACKQQLKAGDDARMGCIMDGNGSTSRIGDKLTFHCPAFDPARTFVNGSDPFPLSTSICWAAVYTGKLDPATGGDVTIEILPVAHEYPKGEFKNGVKSQTWSNSTNGTPGYTFVD
jgi:LCCL domain